MFLFLISFITDVQQDVKKKKQGKHGLYYDIDPRGLQLLGTVILKLSFFLLRLQRSLFCSLSQSFSVLVGILA